jgi:hypothetical protein
MALPGDELKVNIRHVGMRDGNIVVKIETINDHGEKVLKGSAEVAQSTTVYVFTGQGSQEADILEPDSAKSICDANMGHALEFSVKVGHAVSRYPSCISEIQRCHGL